MSFYTYIMASGRNGTIYTGSTDDLVKRYDEHVHKAFQGFTAQYGVNRLVWFECHESQRSLSARTQHQGMAANLEDRADRSDQPDLA
jgi:putative endonuclease